MKAEHRKELETNELADFLGRTVENVKGGDRSSYLTMGAIALGLVAVIGGYIWWSKAAPGGSAALAIKVQEAGDNVKELQKLADENKGTTPARTARFAMARILYQEGLRDLPSGDLRASAIGKMEQSRDLYKQLATETRDYVELTQEAMMQLARAEESLSGAVNPDKPGQPVGSIDLAIKYYKDLAEHKPETFQTKAAAGRQKVLEEKKKQIEEFYARLNEQATKPKK